MREGRLAWLPIALSAVVLFGTSARAGVVEDEQARLDTLFYFVTETDRAWPQLLADFETTILRLEARESGELQPLLALRDDVVWKRAEALFATGDPAHEDRCVALYESLASQAVAPTRQSDARRRLADLYVVRGERSEANGDDAAALDAYRAAVANAPEYAAGYVKVARLADRIAAGQVEQQDFEAALTTLADATSAIEQGLAAEHPDAVKLSARRDQILASTGVLELALLGDARRLDRFKSTGVDFSVGEIRLAPLGGGVAPPAISAAAPRRVLNGRYRATVSGVRGEGVSSNEPTDVEADVEVVREGASIAVPAVIPDRMVWVKSSAGAPGFLCDRYEVSNREFAAFAASERATFTGGPDDVAAGGISFADARRYAAWAGKDLPTASQWTHAAFGAPDRASPKYPWGDAAGRPGTQFFGGQDNPGPVDGCEAGKSVTGVFNMAGNVIEWLADGWLIGGGYYFDVFRDEVDYGQAVDGVRPSWAIDLLRHKIPTGSIYDAMTLDQKNKYTNYQIDETDDHVAKQFGLRCVIPLE